jgi:molybdopterin molybdotransferase
MNSVEQAQSVVRQHARPLAAEHVRLQDALGLVLAEDLVSTVESPPFDKATMDGFAVLASDLSTGEAELAVVEEITAGQLPTRPVGPGTTTRIMTGAPMPAGADAVVIVERSEPVPGEAGTQRVRLRDDHVRAGQNVMARGTAMRRGDRVLAAGREIGPIEAGVMAEIGAERVQAHRRPVVAILVTGNELVPAGASPEMGQIRNSNGPMLRALVERANGRVEDLGIGRDEVDELERLIRQGIQADILVLSGGVSAGVLDLVPSVFARVGIEQIFHKVRLKPGKPLWFGVARREPADKLVFGLPGNPVSALVCFELFVRPAIAGLAGQRARRHALRQAVLSKAHHHRSDRPTFFPAKYAQDCEPGNIRVEPLKWHGSADLFTLAHADCLIVFPSGERRFADGEFVDIYPLGSSEPPLLTSG